MPCKKMVAESIDNDLQTFDVISSVSQERSSFRRNSYLKRRAKQMSSDYDSVPSISAKKFRLVTYIIFVISTVILIVSAIMLDIGISKSSDSINHGNGADNPKGTPPVSPALLKAKVVDIVFLIDQTASTVNNTDQIRQFLSSYVSNFNIGPTATQVTVVGANSAPTGYQYIGFKNSTNLTDLQAQIANIPKGDSSDNGSPNLHKACEFVMQHTFHPNDGRRIDAPVIIVVLIFSPRLDLVYYNTATAVWRSTDLFGISLADYKNATDTLIKFTRSADTVAQVSSIGDLLAPNNAAVQQMSNYIFSIAPQRPVPLSSVQSDIVILLDVTSAMTQDAFSNTLVWLKNFVAYFIHSNIRISVILFDSTVRAGSFNLSENYILSSLLDDLRWPNSTVQNLNLLSAVQYITNTTLSPQFAPRFWSQGLIYVLVIAISPQTVNTCDDIKRLGMNGLTGKADVYGMALTGLLSVETYLNCIIPPFPHMNFAKAVPYSFLIPNGLTDTIYANEVSRSYQRWVDRQSFIVPIPMNQLQLDIVFLVDQTMFLSQAMFKHLQNLMVDFAVSGNLSINSNMTQLSVISYDHVSLSDGSFTLTSAISLDSLIAQINELHWNSASSALSFNIVGAFYYLTSQILTPNLGHDPRRAAAIVVFSSAPSTTVALNSDQVEQVNKMGGVYGVDVTGLGAAPNYLLQATTFNVFNVHRLSNAGTLNPNDEIGTIQRLNSFVSNVADSWTKIRPNA